MRVPPLLLGAALAFWGWRSGNHAAAAVLALLVESPRLVSLRFDLQHTDFARIATLCTALFVGLIAWLFATLEPPRTARAVLTSLLWLPAVLAPLLLAQQYSASGRVPLSAMFRYLRKQRARDPSIPDPPIDLAPIYFALCVVAAGIPNRRDELFYPAVVLLAGWLLAAVRPRHVRASAWVAAMLAAASLGLVAYRGLGELQTVFEDWISELLVAGMGADPYSSTTDLGAVGRLKMVESIVLRVYARPGELAPVKLLHRTSFNSLHGKTWVARNAPLRALEPQADGSTWPLHAETAEPQASVRIVTRLDGGKALLALPAGTMRISGMAAAGVKRNALGATQAEVGGDWAPYVAEFAGGVDDYAPPRAEDTLLPPAEREEFQSLARELGLRPGAATEAIRRVQAHLATFSYSTFRDTPPPSGATPLGDFLRRSRSGHCEYFAAATTLLLRAAGVPARYATGFAVNEYSALEEAYVVRARHAHAWTRAYVGGRWIDIDTTPPSWFAEEDRAAPPWQALADLLRWAGFRWAQRGALEGGAGWYAALALLVGVFVWRLLRGKRTRSASAAARRAFGGADSEFYAVEEALSRRAGGRAAHEPLAAWTTRCASALDAATSAALASALALHNRYRFDPAGLGETERNALRTHCLALARALH